MANNWRKIAILQSNYIPWKGYFDLINSVDEFIILDEVQYTKNDWRNRNRIKTGTGSAWITIPVRHENLHKHISETTVSNPKWNEIHWRTISQNYAKARFFGMYRELFEHAYRTVSTRYLSEINQHFLSRICELLNIRTSISQSKDYLLATGRSERLVGLCKQARANEYVSGPAARAYLNQELFASENIRVTWMNYSGYPEYTQLYPPFDHYVSVIDLIFNEGPEATKYMKSFNHKSIAAAE